jgi:hypothetical protein
MKSLILVFLLSLIIVNPLQSQKKEEKRVRKSHKKYTDAILNDQGAEAVKYVDSRTVTYYSDILNTTLHADSTTIEGLGILDKMMVLLMRHKMSADELLSFDGKSLLIHAVNLGMVGKSGASKIKIGKVTIKGNFASAEIISGGKVLPYSYDFYKEGKTWKIDLTSSFPAVSVAFKQVAQSTEMSENEFIFEIMELASAKKVSQDVWNKIQ